MRHLLGQAVVRSCIFLNFFSRSKSILKLGIYMWDLCFSSYYYSGNKFEAQVSSLLLSCDVTKYLRAGRLSMCACRPTWTFQAFKQQQQCLQHPKRINFRQVTVNSCQEGKIPSHAKIEKTRHSWWPKTHSTFSNLPEFGLFLTDSEKLLFITTKLHLTSEIFSVLAKNKIDFFDQ